MSATQGIREIMADEQLEPKEKLVMIVICQAARDLHSGNPKRAGEALDFFYGEQYEAWAEAFDLGPAFRRRIIRAAPKDYQPVLP